MITAKYEKPKYFMLRVPTEKELEGLSKKERNKILQKVHRANKMLLRQQGARC